MQTPHAMKVTGISQYKEILEKIYDNQNLVYISMRDF